LKKIKFLIWLACHNVALTLALFNHKKKNKANSAICSRCGDQDESFFHCVRDCRFSINIWQRIGFSSLPIFFSNLVSDLDSRGC